jgi:hypothetical protein
MFLCIHIVKNPQVDLSLVAHTCNASYSGSRKEAHSSKPAQQVVHEILFLKMLKKGLVEHLKR